MPPKRACDICYRRKIQCLIPAEGSPCDWCSHHDSDCTFHRDAPRRKKKHKVTLGDVQGLNDRIQQLEDALAQANAQQQTQHDSVSQPTPAISVSEGSSNPASVQSPPPTTIGNSIAFSEHSLSPLVFSQTPGSANDTSATTDGSWPGNYIGPNWFFRGIHAFSENGRRWISSKTGQAIDWSKLRIFTTELSPFSSKYTWASPGQPPLLSDIYCDLTIPDDYLSSYTHLRGLDEYHPSPDESITMDLTPHFWGDAQLGYLKEKVYRLLYSVQALKDKENQLLIHIRQLDDEIECWRLLLMFYATNAAISLFLNMIIHPEDSDGQLDLELLISAANAIRTAIPSASTHDESTRIQRTSDFIMWLTWLGSCAITKSKEEGLQHQL
ncbi:fungal specific transcription factor domain-containing protein [Colletotrichum orchidophilum]|uniref:Fungal specific transcription factor domain-containing protein n=1 Tax=Colletotrichum orchidophilum TaxID=1209926 RepID=A0A1G4BRH9_9PEZI|nr:fungal specific transcription factor domain-containing protein [Colletotrichum orchidophilum]OHF03988.1 fungal specific transcription factor domain-containing protein [Colletotrichum orchidophilum]